jgi:nucleoside-diphosphate-sugar epimerase
MDLENRQKGFAGVFIRQALDGELIRLFGGGSQLRDFNYVDDVVDALLLAGQHDKVVGEVCNLGHQTPHSLNEFVQLLSRETRFETESVPFPDEIKSIDIGDYYGDYSRFNRLTGWEPKVDLAEGLERTVRWFQEQRQL